MDHPSEGSAADDETAALEQPGRPLLTREQEYALGREIQVLMQWRRVRASLAAGSSSRSARPPGHPNAKHGRRA